MVVAPVAYFVFNRPRHTARTFANIRAHRPRELLIVADGPRSGHPTDVASCAEVRSIVERIDWPCEVRRNYANGNLGCRQRVVSGLDWVFDNVSEAVVIEDDILPHSDFFRFCDDLLVHHRDSPQVMAITGCNFQGGRTRGAASYYFSKYNHVWGWATWRRAWRQNDSSMAFWPEWRDSNDWKHHTPNRAERSYWTAVFDRMYRGEIDTWDYSWTASVWRHGGLTATPNGNLVSNIGFGPDATHTFAVADEPGMEIRELGAIVHPDAIRRSAVADRYVFDHHFGGNQRQLHRRLMNWPARAMRRVLQRANILPGAPR